MREAPKDAGERRIGAWGRHDPGSVRRRRSRRAHGNVGGAGVVVCVFGSGSFGNLAAGRPRRRFRGVAAARSGQKHAMQSAAGRARSGFRRAPRRSGGAHVPIASVELSPPPRAVAGVRAPPRFDRRCPLAAALRREKCRSPQQARVSHNCLSRSRRIELPDLNRASPRASRTVHGQTARRENTSRFVSRKK